jgi:hypothetical protein
MTGKPQMMQACAKYGSEACPNPKCPHGEKHCVEANCGRGGTCGEVCDPAAAIQQPRPTDLGQDPAAPHAYADNGEPSRPTWHDEAGELIEEQCATTPRPSARERIERMVFEIFGTQIPSRGSNFWCQAAERVIEAADAREDALREELAALHSAYCHSQEQFHDMVNQRDALHAELAAAKERERLAYAAYDVSLARVSELEAEVERRQRNWEHYRLNTDANLERLHGELARLSGVTHSCAECEAKARLIEELQAERLRLLLAIDKIQATVEGLWAKREGR